MLATTIHKTNTTPHHQDGATTYPPHTGAKNGPVVSGPNSVPSPETGAGHQEQAFLVVGDQSCCRFQIICTTDNPLQAPAKNIPTITSRTVAGTGEHGAP